MEHFKDSNIVNILLGKFHIVANWNIKPVLKNLNNFSSSKLVSNFLPISLFPIQKCYANTNIIYIQYKCKNKKVTTFVFEIVLQIIIFRIRPVSHSVQDPLTDSLIQSRFSSLFILLKAEYFIYTLYFIKLILIDVCNVFN